MIFRIILGIYLTFHFAQLVPYAEELFGNNMPFDPTLSPLYGLFPNILEHVNATYFLIFLTILSILLILEVYTRVVCLILWYGWACLFNRNIFIANPGLPYIGWILIALSLFDSDPERIVFKTGNRFLRYIQRDKFPKRIFWSAWILMAAGYTFSGIHKYQFSQSWVDGTALQHILEGSLARDNFFRDFIIQYPTFLKYSTWFSLFLEISFLPLGVFYHTRFYYWLLYMGFHIGILMLINFTDLTVGVMMIHMATFDWTWTSKINQFIANKIKNKNLMRYGFISSCNSSDDTSEDVLKED